MNPERANPLETITRLFAVLTIACYLIGVFAVNSYLYHLGISSLSSPLKPRFIYTGIVILSSLAFSFFFPMFFIKKIRGKKSKLCLAYIAIFSIPLLVYLFINYLFVILVNNLGVVVLEPCLSAIVVSLYWIGSCIAGGVVSLFLQAFFPNFSRVAGIDYWKIENSKSTRFLVSFLLVVVLSLYITFFGHRVYPLIPEQFGGGQPRIVQILLKSNADKKTQSALKLEEKPANSNSPSITQALLFEEETYYLIGLYTKDISEGLSEGKTKDEKKLASIVQIDREEVAGTELAKDTSKYFLSYILKSINSLFLTK